MGTDFFFPLILTVRTTSVQDVLNHTPHINDATFIIQAWTFYPQTKATYEKAVWLFVKLPKNDLE